MRCALAVVVALGVACWGAAYSVALPSVEELAPDTVALVSDVPDRRGTITKAEFRHALVQVAVGEGFRVAPRPGGREYTRLKRAALSNLLEAAWLKGQAVEMGIVATRGQVLRELAQIKRESFESAAEYRRFLRKSRFTQRDVYERVELQLLAARMQRRIVAGAGNEAAEQKALEDFVAEYNERWRSRTVCVPGYVIDRCSNGPLPE